MFENCSDYNGEDSEYFELAGEMKTLLKQLTALHFSGTLPGDEEGGGAGASSKKGRRRRGSRSPSACKTPELTSESSSEEEEGDSDRWGALIRVGGVVQCLKARAKSSKSQFMNVFFSQQKRWVV